MILKKIALIVLAGFCLTSAYSQKTKTTKEKSKTSPLSKKYGVLKSDLSTKHGNYAEYFNGVIFTTGQYDNGEKTGAWVYFSSTGRKRISAHFEKSERDSVWTYYYNHGGVKCRIFFTDNIPDSVFSYYQNGQISYLQRINSNGDGLAQVYHENGALKQNLSISGYVFSGTCSTYFENGQLHRSTIFKNDLPWTIIETLDINGEQIDGGNLTDGRGTYLSLFKESLEDSEYFVRQIQNFQNGVLEGNYEFYSEPDVLNTIGNYQNNQQVGEWITYNGLNEHIETFEYDETIKTEKSANEEKLHYGYRFPFFTLVEEMPEYEGGENKLMQFLGQNTKYPPEAKKNGIEGTVYVSFIVDIDGTTHSQTILRNPHDILSKEALRVVKLLPRWHPGFQNNVPVSVQYNLPIKFSLR